MYLLPVKNLLSVTVFQFIADVPILMYCFVLSGIFHTNPEVMILSHPMGVSILSVTKVVDSPTHKDAVLLFMEDTCSIRSARIRYL